MIRKFLVYILIAAFAFSSESCYNDIDTLSSSGKLFIIGGGNRSDSLMLKMINEADIGDRGYVFILPMSSEMSDTTLLKLVNEFKELGIEKVTGYNFLPNETPPQIWVDSLRNASLIYISGGDQNRFMQIVDGNAIEEAINYAFNNGAMIAGTSAGAAVMSEKMITGNELKSPEYRATFRTIENENIELAKGLGFITTAIIDQHFVWRSRYNRLISAIIEHPELIGIGIDEATAILVSGNKAKVIGESQVVVFRNPDKSLIEVNGKLGARNLLIDIYLPGEEFEVR
ncbi:MAG: cyanophycinase [Bacteroidetes bacterium]|nr:cyanophycinase [Bacteroidota bacterium]